MEALLRLDPHRPARGEQLVSALREAISDGRLAPGTRLPSTRQLAVDLRLSRGVVVGAYEQLIAEGRLVARHGSGTVVARVAGGTAPMAGQRLPAFEPGDLPLRPGRPDPGLFPRTAWRRAYEQALSYAVDEDLGYGDPAGAPSTRIELAEYLGRVRAARLAPEHIVLTTGAAQAFALIGQVLHARGHTTIGVEEPGSPGLRIHLEAQGLTLAPIPVDRDGLDVSALDRSKVPAVLVTPAHQYPLGVVLAPHRRAELVAWPGLIIEDDYDAEFRYDRDPVGCLQGLAPDKVVHIGSVSKALAPGMRLGWLGVPPSLRDEIRHRKAAADLNGPVLEQLAFGRFLASGAYDRHLRRCRRAYRQRRDALVAALRRHLPDARISGIAAGLHLVVEFSSNVDEIDLSVRAQTSGLGPVPLSQTRLRPGGSPGLILGYAASTPDELDSAVRLLASLVKT